MFKAKDVMNKHVISVDPDATVDEVVALLLRHHLSGLPVVDGEGKPVGIISEYDLLQLMYDLEGTHDTIDQHMSTEVRTVDLDTLVTDIADTFLTSTIRRLPVVDAEGKLMGIVSRRDLIRFIQVARQRVGQELLQLRVQN